MLLLLAKLLAYIQLGWLLAGYAAGTILANTRQAKQGKATANRQARTSKARQADKAKQAVRYKAGGLQGWLLAVGWLWLWLALAGKAKPY